MLFCISCELVPEVEAMMIPVEAVLAFFVRLAAGNGMFTNNIHGFILTYLSDDVSRAVAYRIRMTRCVARCRVQNQNDTYFLRKSFSFLKRKSQKKEIIISRVDL